MISINDNWSLKIESLRSRGRLLHGSGTLYGNGAPPISGWVEVGDSCRIFAQIGTINRQSAGVQVSADFVIYGALPTCIDSGSLFLTIEWPNARRIKLPLPPPRKSPEGRGVAHIRSLPWAHYFSRGWRLVRQRQYGPLLRKLTDMTRALLTSGRHPARLLAWAVAEGKPLTLIIDHDLGGGANLYRKSHVARLVAQGFTPILLTTHHGVLSYQLTATRGGRDRTAFIDDLDTLFDFLSGVTIQHVVFNNILSFPAPLSLIARLAQWLRQNETTKLLFLAHDYYSVCPVWLLLDHRGRYCGIPDATVCSTCLRANTAPYLEFSAGNDITGWRAGWRSLLQQADEIRCFSHASKEILMRAHPALESKRVSVVPHTLDHVQLREVVVTDCGYPVIGIIGHITSHKGANVVRELAHHLIASRTRARIVIIGSIDIELPTSVTTIVGPYRQSELSGLLERNQVNVGFFPSIWPETFSYVAEEMMAMGLPVLTFDLGAPGERVANYRRGMVIPLGEPDSILAAVESLYRTYKSKQIQL